VEPDRESTLISDDAYDDIRVERRGPVGYLTLARPQVLNALRPQTFNEISVGLNRLDQDVAVRVVIFRGEGRAFCAGADLNDEQTHRTPSISKYLAERSTYRVPIFDDFRYLQKPIIAAVQGHAVGAGFLIALHCDFVVVAESASFWLPQAKLGIMPAFGGMRRLAQSVGVHRAMDIGLRCSRIDARKAVEYGMAIDLSSDAELEARTEALAAELAELPPLAAKLIKESMAQAFDEGTSRLAALTDTYRFMALTLTDESTDAHGTWIQ
jgi:enoyl-CoA hydratase